jgi:hypothetical protein
MAIVRNNSFHLLLSDDEQELLRLLAEREGLNASDYLRSLLRQMAGAPPHMAQVMRLGVALAGKVDLGKAFQSQRAAVKLFEAHAAEQKKGTKTKKGKR